jgi:Tol biopolymer transport system component
MPGQTECHAVTRNARPSLAALLGIALVLLAWGAPAAQTPLRERLKASPFKIAFECYVHDNWEIFAMNADGSEPVNLTRTPKEHEHYPQASPDGTRICFVVDQGEDRETVRSVWVMNADGSHRRKLAEYAREPFWSPDGRSVGFLPQEFPKFNVIDFFTQGMSFVDLNTGAIVPHPNSTNIYHAYNPCFAPNGKWIVATAHAGMGVDHGILAIEARGTNLIDLKIPGCRAWVSPDGRQIAWGAGDYEIAVAPISLDSGTPTVGERRLRIQDETNRVIHVDWSPDSRFLCFSRGPAGVGDPTKPGTFSGSCGLMGVYAPGWDLCVVSAERDGILDLNHATEADFCMATTNGLSNKEPAWFRPKPKAKE